MNPFARFAAVAVLGASALAATAETYRWTDPATGRTVVSNQPPPAGVTARRIGAGSAPENTMPAELREPMERFPVVYYTAPTCLEICNEGRQHLRTRGVPYSEVAVETPEEFAAMMQKTGDMSIPALLVGRQAYRGFELGSWNHLLDLAGYPQRPLPGYRPPPIPVRRPPIAVPVPATDAASAPVAEPPAAPAAAQ